MPTDPPKQGQKPPGLPDDVFVHPAALVETADVGSGTRVWGFTHLKKGARVGSGCNLGEHVYIEDGAVVGNRVTVKNGVSLWDRVEIADEVFVGPHAVFTNVMKPRAFIRTPPADYLPTKVGRGATIGAGAVIVCGTTLGEYCFIAAGAVVTQDVPAHGLVMGNPGRLFGFVCRCAKTFGKLAPPPLEACTECRARFGGYHPSG